MLLDGKKKDNNKPFWQFVKSQKKVNIGVDPLQTDKGNQIAKKRQKC